MCGTAEDASKTGCVTASTSGLGKATTGFMQDIDNLLADEAWWKETVQVYSLGTGTVVPSQDDEDKAHCGVCGVCGGEEWTLSPGHIQPLILHQWSALVPHR